MQTALLVIHLAIAAALVGVVLLQRSEGGGLGMGGGGGSFMSGRGTANVLTRATIGLGAAFFVTSIGLTVLARHGNTRVSPLDLPASGSAPSSPAGAAKTPSGGVLDSLEKGKQRLPSLPKSQ